MGEVIEVNLISQSEIHDSLLQILLGFINPEYYPESFEAMDDWTYSNLVTIDGIESVDTYIPNKIVTIKYKDYFMNQVGLYIEKKADNYQYEGWLNFSEDCSDERYQKIIERLHEEIKKTKPVICAIGRESYVDFDLPLSEVKSKSSGVDLWITNL